MVAVPFLDLKAQYETIRGEIADALLQVLDKTAFAGGPFVAQFEEEFARFCGCDHAIGVGSGTDALWMTLVALGIHEGDEVITATNTFIATAEAISYCGATPVFVDVDEATYNMDPECFRAAITPRTKAVIPVHLYGQPADMDPIMEIAREHGLLVVEDACQAHGAEYKGRKAGSIGDAGCFSFYPGKNLGAYGEAGGVITDNADLANNLRRLRDHGQTRKYYHSLVGWNGRMDGFQGAVLSVKLKHLAAWTEARRQHAHAYDELLGNMDGLILPCEAPDRMHVYHIYAVRIRNRDSFIGALAERKIFCGIHYPVPLHLQEAYSSLGYKQGDFPVAERCALEQVSLPMFAELSLDQIEFIAASIRELVG